MSQPYPELQVITAEGSQAIRLTDDHASLADVLRRQGYPLNTRCGQRGICEGCQVEVHQGHLVGQMNRYESKSIEPATAAATVKACAWRLAASNRSAVIHIPERSLLTYQAQAVSDFHIRIPHRLEPVFPAGDAPALGVSLDIGTTTVALLLVDLSNGQIVGRASAFNRQMHLGDDVLTRINLCMTDETMVRRLQDELWQHTIQPLIAQARRGLDDRPMPDHLKHAPIRGLVLAGNSTMQHLAAGVNPSPMGTAPFAPAFLEHRVENGRHFGATIEGLSDDAPAHLLPGAAAYVGADIVAGVLSSGMAEEDGPVLLVDVGTNGEIVLKTKGKMIGCATAAGPAFEGAGLVWGVRAGRGAIESIRLEVGQPPAIQTIGHDTPMGICGSAYIDFLAQARRIDLIDPMGHFDPAIAGDRLFELEPTPGHGTGQQAYRLTDGSGKKAIAISQGDIGILVQAKAAIAAGIVTLLNESGLKPSDIKRLYLAGGFGTKMDHRHAIACGLPPGFALEQVQVVGNSSLAGAYLALIDQAMMARLTTLSHQIEVLELNPVPGFEDTYLDQFALP